MAEGARRAAGASSGLACAALAAVLWLAGCASGPRGGSDGADAEPPAGLAQVPDAEPRVEPIRAGGGTSKPYVVLGRSYVPIADDRAFRERGLASWYGRKFHGQSTASGEPYDMYAMTAAHKTLPIPSYVRVRNPANGREAIVRVNDRGPFHDDRVIDLSYTAALKLDLLRGVAPVEIERITNDEIRAGTWRRGPAPPTRLAAGDPAAPAVADTASVSVPAAYATPVLAAPRAEVRDLGALPATDAGPSSAAAALPPAPPQTPGASTDGRGGDATSGFWVQLGAFSQYDGALRYQAQIARDMPGLANRLNVFSESGTHRLQAGPYASRDLARDTAEQLRNGLRLVPVIVERR